MAHLVKGYFNVLFNRVSCLYYAAGAVIFVGYFDYVKQLGYSWGHIWACPPSEGDDYIFHSHPAEQKVPKPKRLQEWYKKMLDKVGVIEIHCSLSYSSECHNSF